MSHEALLHDRHYGRPVRVVACADCGAECPENYLDRDGSCEKCVARRAIPCTLCDEALFNGKPIVQHEGRTVHADCQLDERVGILLGKKVLTPAEALELTISANEYVKTGLTETAKARVLMTVKAHIANALSGQMPDGRRVA